MVNYSLISFDNNKKIITELLDLINQNNLCNGVDLPLKLENYKKEISILREKRKIHESYNNHNLS